MPRAPYIVIAGPGSQRIVGGTHSFDCATASRLAGRFPPAIVVNADWYRRNYNRDPLAGLTCPDPPKAKEGRPPGSNTQKNPATETSSQRMRLRAAARSRRAEPRRASLSSS